jgi:hypothetical protein
MVATDPIFYRIPITQELLESIVTAQYPAQATVIQIFVPPIANPQEGMVPLDNRRVILQCFEAFKQLLVCFTVFSIAQFLTNRIRIAIELCFVYYNVHSSRVLIANTYNCRRRRHSQALATLWS